MTPILCFSLRLAALCWYAALVAYGFTWLALPLLLFVAGLGTKPKEKP